MSVSPTVTVDVQLACDDADIPHTEKIRGWISRTLSVAAKPAVPDTEVSVRVVGADEMRSLNKDYRQQDKPTNVLAFPAGDVAGLPTDGARFLGDIVVCAAVVRDEAVLQNKAITDHWAHMLVHGTLHLIGYDHIHDNRAADMERLETSILAADGVTDPYTVQ